MNHQDQQDAALATDIQDYQKCLARISPSILRLLHAAIGLCTEAGELQDQLKKHIFYGKPLDLVNLFEEGGDSSWYLRLLAHELSELAAGRCSFEEMIDRNIAKLKQRYPEKFTEHFAVNRNLAAERTVLEGVTKHLTDGGELPIKDACNNYKSYHNTNVCVNCGRIKMDHKTDSCVHQFNSTTRQCIKCGADQDFERMHQV